jgi:hypothetical protein
MKKKGFGAVKYKPAICQEDLINLYDVNGVALNPCTPQGLLNTAPLEPSFGKIVIGWSSSKIVSGGPTL